MNRPDLNFRGFSGTVASGRIKPGEEIITIPSDTADTKRVKDTRDSLVKPVVEAKSDKKNKNATIIPDQSIPKIVLMAREDTWVKISESSGEVVIEKVMKSGDTYFLPERNNLIISAGNADAIEVFIDGDEHSFLGTLNDVSQTN